MTRVVVLTSSPKGTAADCLPELLQSEQIEIVAVVQAQGPNSKTQAQRWSRKLRKIKKIGMLGALNGVRIRSWFQHENAENLENSCRRHNIPFHLTPFIGSAETAEIFRKAQADLGVSLGNSYIPESIFSIPAYGMINFHGERLPGYQNAQSVIWAIHNLELVTGLTVHQISDRIDTGSILYREEYPIEFLPTLEATVRKTLAETRKRCPVAVRHVCENYHALAVNAEAQKGGAHYTTPSIWQFVRMVRNNRELHRMRQVEIQTQ